MLILLNLRYYFNWKCKNSKQCVKKFIIINFQSTFDIKVSLGDDYSIMHCAMEAA